MKTLLGCLCVLWLGIASMALAQTTKGRTKVDANKKWELMHDASGQVLASCDAQLKCEVSEQLKQMIACHDQMKQAMASASTYLQGQWNQSWTEFAKWDKTMQECVTAK